MKRPMTTNDKMIVILLLLAPITALKVTQARPRDLHAAAVGHGRSVLINLAQDPVAFKKTKHILRAAKFMRDLVAKLVVRLEHVPGGVMIADVLTKAVSRMTYVELLRMFDLFCATGQFA